mgnify:CR=1 FL=1
MVCNKLDVLADRGSISEADGEGMKKEIITTLTNLLEKLGASTRTPTTYYCETITVDNGSRIVVREGSLMMAELNFCFISCKRDANIDGLVSEITRLAHLSLSSGSASASADLCNPSDTNCGEDDSNESLYSVALTQREDSYVTRERHREHLARCSDRLDRILSGKAYEFTPLDVLAEELRLALRDLGLILGKVDVEELLDVIFRDFCIGK